MLSAVLLSVKAVSLVNWCFKLEIFLKWYHLQLDKEFLDKFIEELQAVGEKCVPEVGATEGNQI